MKKKLSNLSIFLKNSKLYKESKAVLCMMKLSSENIRPIVFIDLDETIIANIRASKENLMDYLFEEYNKESSDLVKGEVEDSGNIIQQEYNAARNFFDSNIIHESRSRSIMIRPKIKELILKLNEFADIYIMTATTQKRADLVWNILPSEIKSLIKGISSSKPVKKNVYRDDSWNDRPYVLIDDNSMLESFRNQMKHAIIKNKEGADIVSDLVAMSKNKEYIDIEDFHITIPEFKPDIFEKLTYSEKDNFSNIEDLNFNVDLIISEVKNKLKQQSAEIKL